MIAKRLSMSLLAVGLISLVVSAATFALFSATTTNTNNTFTAGTVTLGTPSTTLVNVTNIAPGDSGSGTYSVEYTGSLDAWLGLDTALSGDLTSCDGGGHFVVNISDGVNSYGANAMNQVIGAAPVATGAITNLTVNWALALAAGNDCQADSATLSMTVHAVQSRNNTNATNDGPISWN